MSTSEWTSLAQECGGDGAFEGLLGGSRTTLSVIPTRKPAKQPRNNGSVSSAPKRVRVARTGTSIDKVVRKSTPSLSPPVQLLTTAFDADDTQFARMKLVGKTMEAKIRLMYGAVVLIKALMQTTPALVQPALMAKLVELAKMQRVLYETFPELARDAVVRPEDCPSGVEPQQVAQALETIASINRGHAAALRRARQHDLLRS